MGGRFAVLEFRTTAGQETGATGLDRIRNSVKESENVRGAVSLRKTALLSINSPYTNSQSGLVSAARLPHARTRHFGRKPAKIAGWRRWNRQKPAKIAYFRRKPKETCGNRAFPIDFAYLKAAL
jgi:hypothetical protein